MCILLIRFQLSSNTKPTFPAKMIDSNRNIWEYRVAAIELQSIINSLLPYMMAFSCIDENALKYHTASFAVLNVIPPSPVKKNLPIKKHKEKLVDFCFMHGVNQSTSIDLDLLINCRLLLPNASHVELEELEFQTEIKEHIPRELMEIPAFQYTLKEIKSCVVDYTTTASLRMSTNIIYVAWILTLQLDSTWKWQPYFGETSSFKQRWISNRKIYNNNNRCHISDALKAIYCLNPVWCDTSIRRQLMSLPFCDLAIAAAMLQSKQNK